LVRADLRVCTRSGNVVPADRVRRAICRLLEQSIVVECAHSGNDLPGIRAILAVGAGLLRPSETNALFGQNNNNSVCDNAASSFSWKLRIEQLQLTQLPIPVLSNRTRGIDVSRRHPEVRA
jgi:hypothetical protein